MSEHTVLDLPLQIWVIVLGTFIPLFFYGVSDVITRKLGFPGNYANRLIETWAVGLLSFQCFLYGVIAVFEEAVISDPWKAIGLIGYILMLVTLVVAVIGAINLFLAEDKLSLR